MEEEFNIDPKETKLSERSVEQHFKLTPSEISQLEDAYFKQKDIERQLKKDTSGYSIKLRSDEEMAEINAKKEKHRKQLEFHRQNAIRR